ncbi:hypothetical protein [Thiocapsa sp. N5-Cardenillas]|uniref:hypothetical protein n=1 Tax=Thiocapsa sp. N5-Cardenillas TaxID=3137397 RepID=UPI0035B416DC
MNLMQKVVIPEQAVGEWRVERFRTDNPERALHYALHGRPVPVGEEFTRLMRGQTLVMSDTPAEMRDHIRAVFHAKGRCLMNGLGLGMVLKAILLKPEVTAVTVIEKAPEVIAMVAPHYRDPRVEIIEADAFTFTPPKAVRYQMVWHDIWDSICSDNLPEMHRLHRRYGRRADWQGSWCRWQCEREKRVGIWP